MIQIVFGPVDTPLSYFTANTYANFRLTVPIVWDGISNLIIDISTLSVGFDRGAGTAYFYIQRVILWSHVTVLDSFGEYLFRGRCLRSNGV